jgi:MFS family permease
VGALALTGHANVTVIVVISVASGIVSIPDSPARQAFISSLVTPDDLSSAISLNGIVVNSARVMALWVFVYIGTTPIGSIIDGAITKAGGTRAALLTGAAACLVAAFIASLVRTPPHPDAALTDLVPQREPR